jgi:hypothetical protein
MLIIFKKCKLGNEAVLTIFYTFLFVNTEMMFTFAVQLTTHNLGTH